MLLESQYLRWASFKLHKDSNDADEYEDSCDGDAQLGHFAIADGASESSFAADWARLLVHRFIQEPVCEASQWKGWLPPIQKEWCARVDVLELPWYAQEKAAHGAYATFLGLVIERQGNWHAVAVGDCCLLHRRHATNVAAPFPIERSADFNSTPALIGARSPADDIARRQTERRKVGTWEPGDTFFLMTDALAQWRLRSHENAEAIAPGDDPLWASTQEEFAQRIAWRRQRKQLKNDDVTLLRIVCVQ